MKKAFGLTGIVLAGLALSVAAPAVAEDQLRAVTAFPKTLVYSQSFLRFVDKVNAAGKGVVQISYIGGPEAVPVPEQPEALRNGVVDMQYGPASYYPGIVPESDALVGSNRTPMENRASGGTDLLNKIHQKKLNAYYLGTIDGGIQFHIYLRDAPKRTASGGVDLNGLKIRAAPIYREFFAAMGIVPVNVPVPEVYTSLERGVVDGMGWTSTGLMDFKWDRFLKYRIDPGFFQTDLGIMVNLPKWNKLSDKSRQLLQKAAIEYEKESYDWFQALRAKEEAELKKSGLNVVALPPAEAKKFLDQAYQIVWDRLKGRDASNHDQLKSRYYKN